MRRMLVLALVVAAVVVVPIAQSHSEEGHAEQPVIQGAGEHVEGPDKAITMPDGSARALGPLTTEFSITHEFITCMVGEVGGEHAPFNMIMYSTAITKRSMHTNADGSMSYKVEGLIRSISKVGGVDVEDVVTPFKVVATDGSPNGKKETHGDSFQMSIDTTLWPKTTFGLDPTGAKIPVFGGDIAIGHAIAGAS